MRNFLKAAAIGVVFASGAVPAMAQHQSVVESSLVGVKLFATGMDLLTKFGEPDEIQGLGGGGGGGAQAAPAAGPVGFGGPPAPAGGGAGGGRPPNLPPRGVPMMGEWLPSDPMAFTDEVFFQRGMPPAGMPRNGAPVSPGNFLGGGGGGGGNNPRPGGGGGGAPAFGFGGGGGGGAATGTSAATSSDSYSRWVYRRDGAKYGFIVDRDNKVVQIEAVALKDPKAVTRKGLTFGATFIKVIKTYGWPESYEVAGNTITMRYLVKNHVIFRLNRLGLDKPHVITGILIAAAKS